MSDKSYIMKIFGLGAEIVIGSVEPRVFDYFKNHKINLYDYTKGDTVIDKNFYPYPPGKWYKRDDIRHKQGIDLSEMSYFYVIDDRGQIIYSSTLSIDSLKKLGCKTQCVDSYDVSKLPTDKPLFFGQVQESGKFYEVPLEITNNFDVRKLLFKYSKLDDWNLCFSISYDGVEFTTNQETTCKSEIFALLCKEISGHITTYDGAEI